MTEHSDSASSEKLKSKKTGGGSAFGGGASFQSSLTAIVAARRRLTGKSTGDLSAAFHVLRSRNVEPCPEVIEIALGLLCSECKNTSASAAELLSCWLNQAVVIDADKVDKAIEHWGCSQTAKSLRRLHTPLHSIIELSDKIRATTMAAEK
ncbi:hypothetical protein [Pseudomonas sp. CCC3.1]|uniref:hypothetical protein n=1 Tax=Pseudomonas sp. CCC3.1 TaxID=3048607 RepID=UPI002AC91C53|nr:hypothetical protein [Pseudomonas sp. CCC3.1]MEB0207727.1 hypothetical protein [Pseudomonas sp. CCC3.1]WPX38860.1 hypothetical protein RHM56_12010 [Pseudomonas sp. CCC3.1]